MTLRPRVALREGVQLAASRNGLLIWGAFALLMSVSVTFSYTAAEYLLPLGLHGTVGETASPGGGLSAGVQAFVTQSAAWLGSLVMAVLQIPVDMVAIRTFVADEHDRIPEAYVFSRLERASLSSLGVAALSAVCRLLAVAVVIGPLFVAIVVLSVHPIFLVAVGVLSLLAFGFVQVLLWFAFVFADHEIAVRDVTVSEAVAGSWARTRGDRLQLFVLFVLLWTSLLAVLSVWYVLIPQLGLLGLESTTVTYTGQIVLTPLASMLSLAVGARAYAQLAPQDDDIRAPGRPIERSDGGVDPAPR